jgi:hypothetical protein
MEYLTDDRNQQRPILDELRYRARPKPRSRRVAEFFPGILLGLVMGSLYRHPPSALTASAWTFGATMVVAFVVLSLPFAFREVRRNRRHRAAELRATFGCWACGYSLAGCPPEPSPSDGCTVCPECGAAWRLPATSSTASNEPRL